MGGFMIEIEFMTGNEQHMPFPEYVKAVGLSERFTVLQENTYHVRVPDTTFDEAVWRTLLAFISGYDSSAHVLVAETEKDVGREERPLSTYMERWDAQGSEAKEDYLPDPPAVIVLRTEAVVRLYMVTEYYYESGGPYPYGDACVYSLYSDGDISKDVMAYLHNHANLSRWRFAEKVLDAENVPAPLQRHRLSILQGWGLPVLGVAIFVVIKWMHLFGV
jgi:hypothetical protein